jgi:hypothetical protein
MSHGMWPVQTQCGPSQSYIVYCYMIVNDCPSFADQGKQSYAFCFRLQQTNGSLPFPFSVCSKQTKVGIFLWFRFPFAVWRYENRHEHENGHGRGHGNMEEDMNTWTRTWKEVIRHGNMGENMATWTRTWKHGRGHGCLVKIMKTETMTWKHGRGQETRNRKQKARQFSLIRLPFAHCANGSLSFVCFLTKRQTDVIRLQTD